MSFSSDPSSLVNQLSVSIDYPDPKQDEFIEILTLDRKRIVDAVNTKEGSIYQLQELGNFQQYYSTDPNNVNLTRNTYRRVYDLVSLNLGVSIPIGVTNIVLSGDNLINGIFQPTRGYGAAIIVGPIYIFYPGPDGNVRFDNTIPAAQILRITNTSGAAWTTATWVMEYTKN